MASFRRASRVTTGSEPDQVALASRGFRPGWHSSTSEQVRIVGALDGLYQAVMVAVIVLLDQLIWRPVIAWSEKFKVEQVDADDPRQREQPGRQVEAARPRHHSG